MVACENLADNSQHVSLQTLSRLGILYWKLDLTTYETDGTLPEICDSDTFSNRTTITSDDADGSDLQPSEQIEEISFGLEGLLILGGRLVLDVRNREDKWIRMTLSHGELIVLPRGIYHRFQRSMTKSFTYLLLRTTSSPMSEVRAIRSNDTDKSEYRRDFVSKYLSSRDHDAYESKISPNGRSFVIGDRAKALAKYPHMREANGLLFVSGTSSRRPNNTHIGAVEQADGSFVLDIREQTRAVFENIRMILRQAGANLDHLIDLTVFLTDMKYYRGFNEVYNEYFDTDTGPSRTTVAVYQLPHPNLIIEIKATALSPPEILSVF
uniref:2-Aminomuconate deaminase n=1 Tax=Hirondellea gigas TaxID=1518452 RepID=A0A6A7GEQ9_9CRUS